jgi:DNA modification methylase
MEINKIYQGDCLDVLKTLPDESVDLVFTDPPYNISSKNKIFMNYQNGKKANISFDFGEWDYNFNIVPFLTECKRILKLNGSIIVWTSEQLYGEYRKWFQDNMYPKQLLVWVKSNPLPQFRLVGYRQSTELMLWATKNKNKKDNPNFIFQSQREMTNVFYAPIVGGKERTSHPTQKPLSITEKIIKVHCQNEGVVLDPFAGSGTTLVAAQKLGRKWIGIELNPEYIEIANKRLKPYLEQTNITEW